MAEPTSSKDQDVAYLAFTQGYWQLWVMNHDGVNHKQVTHSHYDKSRVSWYTDGKYLLLNGNQGELVKVDVLTGKEIPIVLPLKGMNDAVISPDGKQILFSLSTSDSIDDNNIWLVNTDGNQLKKLTNMSYLQHEPVWAPDGNSLYFLSGKGDQSHDIWRFDLKDKRQEQLTVAQLYHFDIAVSPNGDLAFSSNRSGNYEIWIQGQNQTAKQITAHPALDARPTWSPDGTTLIFESTRNGHAGLWKIPVKGGAATLLTHHQDGARAPVWWYTQ